MRSCIDTAISAAICNSRSNAIDRTAQCRFYFFAGVCLGVNLVDYQTAGMSAVAYRRDPVAGCSIGITVSLRFDRVATFAIQGMLCIICSVLNQIIVMLLGNSYLPANNTVAGAGSVIIVCPLRSSVNMGGIRESNQCAIRKIHIFTIEDSIQNCVAVDLRRVRHFYSRDLCHAVFHFVGNIHLSSIV